MITIEEAVEVDLDLVAAFERLTPVLSSSASPPDSDELARIIGQPGTTLFIARDDERGIVGTLTLVTFRIPTGLRAWIEDVIADPAASGQGIGAALSRAALDKARTLGCKTVELTSRPSREAANHLYKKIGFEPRETNVYRYDLSSS